MIDKILLELKAVLGDKNVKVNEPLSTHNTWKIGGPARYYFEAKTSQDLITAVNLSRKLKLRYFIIGGGSNILVSDEGYNGLIIKNSTSNINIAGVKGIIKNRIKTEIVYLEADSGVLMNRLVRFSLEEGLSNLEDFIQQPGTVGGSLYINSHFMKTKKFIGDYVHTAKLIDNNGGIQTVNNTYFRFGYDQSVIQKTREIVVSAIFKLIRSTKEAVWEKATDIIKYRQLSQPQGYPTAGCTFRNINQAEAMAKTLPNNTQSAGFLIDSCGLKGYAYGGAQISEKHANFILNTNQAKASDVKYLIDLCKNKVKQKYDIDLHEEIVYLT